ncbi:hypothetical protein GEMRC1_004293 [Eukaryota sp. GEM-RC1]
MQLELEINYFLTMNLQVKTLTGATLSLTVEESDKVSRIKQRIQEKEGIHPSQQRIIFNGQPLNDEQTVSSCGIKAGDCVHLVLALRGGL